MRRGASSVLIGSALTSRSTVAALAGSRVRPTQKGPATGAAPLTMLQPSLGVSSLDLGPLTARVRASFRPVGRPRRTTPRRVLLNLNSRVVIASGGEPVTLRVVRAAGV